MRDPARSRALEASAYVMAAMWLGYGVMHFTVHEEAVRQMPTWFPLKAFCVYVTGAGELAVAVGLCIPRARRIAGFGAVALLAIFTPAVLHIVIADVVPVEWPEHVRVACRWLLIPHNLAFGYWAFRIARARSLPSV